MFENYVKNKNAKFTDDNEFVNNHWQCILHSEKVSQVKRLKINDGKKAEYSAMMF